MEVIMASIDWGMIGLGALVGVGCRKQLRAATRVAASTAASLAGVAAATAQQIANEANKSQASAEEQAAAEMLQRLDQQIAGQQPQAGQNNQNPNGQ